MPNTQVQKVQNRPGFHGGLALACAPVIVVAKERAKVIRVSAYIVRMGCPSTNQHLIATPIIVQKIPDDTTNVTHGMEKYPFFLLQTLILYKHM